MLAPIKIMCYNICYRVKGLVKGMSMKLKLKKDGNQSSVNGSVLTRVITHDDAGSPYLSARREWTERYGSYIKQAHNWRMAAAGALAVSVVLAGGVVWQASQSKVVPYIVEVNHLGRAIAVSPAEEAAMPNTQVIMATLAEEVWKFRTVIPNNAAMDDNIKAAYKYVDSNAQAYDYLNAYYQRLDAWMGNNPGVVRTVKITNVLPDGKNTWLVYWTESESGFSNSSGNGKEQAASNKHYKAVVDITVVPPTTESAILANPLGIYIKSITWSETLQ